MNGTEIVQISPLPGIENALADVHKHAFEVPWSVESFAALIQQPGMAIWISKDAGRAKETGESEALHGFVLCRQAGPEAEILTLAVRPRARRKGIGKALVMAVCGASEGADSSVFLEVNEGNVPAIGLYGALGFEIVGRRAKYYKQADGSTADALVMVWKQMSSD